MAHQATQGQKEYAEYICNRYSNEGWGEDMTLVEFLQNEVKTCGVGYAQVVQEGFDNWDDARKAFIQLCIDTFNQ